MTENSGGPEETIALAVQETIPTTQEIRARLQEIDKYRNDIHSLLIPGVDFDKLPGTQRATLLKPGAEKAIKLRRLRPVYELTEKVMDLSTGFIQYEYKCILYSRETGEAVDEGVGECNSWESKYRWREQKRRCPQCEAESIFRSKEEYGGGWYCNKKAGGCGKNYPKGTSVIEAQQVGRIENEDPADQFNTVKKMAKKRALIDGALSACNLSGVFTQDLEDMAEFSDPEPASVRVEPSRAEPAARAEPAKASAEANPPDPAPQNGSPAESAAPASTVDPTRFENVGHLMTAAKNDLHLTYTQVKVMLKIENPAQITDYVAAWDQLVKVSDKLQATFT